MNIIIIIYDDDDEAMNVIKVFFRHGYIFQTDEKREERESRV